MAVTTSYTLKIGGILDVPYGPRSSLEQEWRAVIGAAPSNDGKPRLPMATDPDLEWPAGFLRPNVLAPTRRLSGAGNYAYDLGGGWRIEEWKIITEPSATAMPMPDMGAATKIAFTAEAAFEGHGGIDDHKDSLTRDAVWFFQYATRRWHQGLTARLAVFNRRHHNELIEPVRFQEFEFYCGNGGGGGE